MIEISPTARKRPLIRTHFAQRKYLTFQCLPLPGSKPTPYELVYSQPPSFHSTLPPLTQVVPALQSSLVKFQQLSFRVLTLYLQTHHARIPLFWILSL